MFNFKENNPKERIKEFGSGDWTKNNKITILIISITYMLCGYLISEPLIGNILIAVSVLPIIIYIPFATPDSFAFRLGVCLQCFWYFPVLFWRAYKYNSTTEE